MRLAIVGFYHESNTFAPVAADLCSWREHGILAGEEIIERYGESKSTVGGFLEFGRNTGVDVVPLVFAWMTPSGPSTTEAYEYLCTRMIAALDAEGPWDGVLLPQHGAGVAEGSVDADGEFAKRVRAAVGPHVRIGAALDMHANISPDMAATADVITAYQTNPHVDAAEQAFRCAELIVAAIEGAIFPAQAVVRLPIAINILRQGTDDEPMAGLLHEARRLGEQPGVLSISLVEGFPYADVPWMGASVVVIADGDAALAHETAAKLAATVWAARAEMTAQAAAPDEAMAFAITSAHQPVLLFDTGDNVWAGSPGDSTHLLHAARRAGRGVGISILDPIVARAALDAGVGRRLRGEVGGRTDALHGAPFPFEGVVIAVHDGRFVDDGPTHGGTRHFNLGATAGIVTDDGFHLAVHSMPSSTVSQEQFRIAGIDPRYVPILVLKGVHSPRAAFEPLGGAPRRVGTPGATTADLLTLPYTQRGPMYPFEPELSWSPTP